MKRNIVIALGWLYTDIDVLACGVAYKELLDLKRINSDLVDFGGTFNKSVTDTIRKWNFQYLKPHNIKDCDFVIVDISDPGLFPKYIHPDKVIRIFDHHYGFKDFWEKKIGSNAIIDDVGSCATLIWEEYKKEKLNKVISKMSANLLLTAIISNTLNFKASVTNIRDVNAYDELNPYSSLSDHWIEKYFEEQERMVLKNPIKEIRNDTSDFLIPSLNRRVWIGQIELWDSREFFNNNTENIKNAFSRYDKNDWFLTSPSISEGINYVYCEDSEIKAWLSKVLRAKFIGDLGKTDRLWLRKEIRKKF